MIYHPRRPLELLACFDDVSHIRQQLWHMLGELCGQYACIDSETLHSDGNVRDQPLLGSQNLSRLYKQDIWRQLPGMLHCVTPCWWQLCKINVYFHASIFSTSFRGRGGIPLPSATSATGLLREESACSNQG